jgi:hypothetical protein
MRGDLYFGRTNYHLLAIFWGYQNFDPWPFLFLRGQSSWFPGSLWRPHDPPGALLNGPQQAKWRAMMFSEGTEWFELVVSLISTGCTDALRRCLFGATKLVLDPIMVFFYISYKWCPVWLIEKHHDISRRSPKR